MSLNNLKPAWKQFILFNSMQPIDQQEILCIIEHADRQATDTLPRFVMPIILLILTACCQGG